jgi:hypothetical protein
MIRFAGFFSSFFKMQRPVPFSKEKIREISSAGVKLASG